VLSAPAIIEFLPAPSYPTTLLPQPPIIDVLFVSQII